jgi:biotin transport system substrate-specific component
MQQTLTLTRKLWPSPAWAEAPVRWIARNAVLAVLFSALIGASAHLQVRLGFTPVPITGQTFGVLLAAALLGPRLGVATLLLYIAEGLLGLPVFASAAGVSGYGYLAGFVVAAGVVGRLAERGWDRKPLATAAMMICGSIAIYVFGVAWLQYVVGGLGKTVLLGVAPFIAGDAIKAAAASVLLPLGWKLLDRPGAKPGRAS